MALVPDPILLWSASNAVKHMICRRYLGYHHVWCSPIFDSSAAGRHATGGGFAAASSDPAEIYRRLLKDVQSNDRHSNEINRQSDGLQAMALKLRAAAMISDDQASEIVQIVAKADRKDWRPLIYVIPYALVKGRVQNVPPAEWAGLEPEYIVPDLVEQEFHVIEPISC